MPDAEGKIKGISLSGRAAIAWERVFEDDWERAFEDDFPTVNREPDEPEPDAES